jgi:hypothetical protein
MKPSFELSPDVAKLVAFLTDRQKATYGEMSDLTGRQINGRDRYVLISARRVLEAKKIYFAVDRGIGLTRATTSQVAILSTSHPITKMRRIERVARRRQAHVNTQELTDEDRLAFDIGRSVLAAIRNDTSKSLRARLAREIAKNDGGVVSIGNLLALPRHRKA